MASPKHAGFLVLSSSVVNLDWDSPSAKTGTVKRRPNSCGDRLVCHQDTIRDDPTDDAKTKDRKASLDANGLQMRDDRTEEASCFKFIDLERVHHKSEDKMDEINVDDFPVDVDEVLQIEISGAECNILDSKTILSKPTTLFCSESLEKGHKFLIDKTGKVKPETATLFSPDASNSDVTITKQKSVKLKEPNVFRRNSQDAKITVNAIKTDQKVRKGSLTSPEAIGIKTIVKESKLKLPKLKLTFSPSKTSDRSKFKMFSTKSSESKQTNLMSFFKDAPKQAASNEYVKVKFSSSIERKNYGVVSKIPSKLPKTPIDSENRIMHLSPNKKYTVTSQHGVRFDKENYVIYDPESGFDARNDTTIVMDVQRDIRRTEGKALTCFESSVSDTDSGIISPMSPFDSGSDLDRRNSRVSPLYGRLRGPGFYTRSDYENVISEIVNNVSEDDLRIETVAECLEERTGEQEKIYTDWANHYLERGRSARRVRALAECRDGELLRDLLESVTGQRVPAVRQYDTVAACLHFLHTQRVQGLEQVTAEDIREGKLKAILALFFALSRHKQAAKQQQKTQQYQQLSSNQLAGQHGGGPVGKAADGLSCVNRMTGGAACEDLLAATNANMVQHRQANKAAAAAGTAIPLPRRARPLPPTPGSNGTAKGGGSAVSASSSRSSSPGGNSRPNNLLGIVHQNSSHGSRPNSSLLAPGSKIPSSPYSTQPTSPGAPTPPPHQNQNVPTKHSMLDKLKLFKDKSSSDRHKNNSVISKRTSSSSGFSSAKSERSDSSLSLNESHNIPNSHIKGQNAVSKQLPQTDLSLGRENQKASGKNLKSKLAASKCQKDNSLSSSKPQKSEKSSKNSPKLQVKEKESKLTAPKSNQNQSKMVLIEDNAKSPKLTMKPQDTKISRLSGSQMKLCNDQKMPDPNAHKVQASSEAKTVASIQPPKACAPSNALPNSNSNTSFVANPSVPAQPNNTGIPKPTAAVKGTSKLPKEDKPIAGVAKSTSNNAAQMSPSQSNSTLMTNSTNSTAAMPFSRELSSLTKENCQKQTLVVSPMPNTNSDNHPASAVATNPAISSQMSESSNSNSTHSASTGPHSNSSDGSVIYRPSSESGSEMSKMRHNPIIPNRKIDTTAQFITEIIPENETKKKLYSEDDERIEVKMTRERMVAKEAADRNIDRTRVCDSPSHGRDNSLGDEDNPSMNVLPMRPLLRGYNSHLTLPARTSGPISAKNGVPAGFPHHANTVKANFGRENVNMNFRNGQYGGYASSEYCDVEIAAGYLSEGDCMRRLGSAEAERERERVRARAGDMMDGYLSEGGASLYARRMHGFQPAPGMQQFDDRAHLPSQRNVSGQGVQGGPMDPQYRAAPQRAKKAEAGQQTDATNYKILNSNGHGSKNGDSQWKKYTDSPGVGSPVQSGGPPSPLSGRRRAGGSSSGQRSKQQPERMSAAQQLQTTAPPPQQMHYAALNSGQHPSKMGPGGQLQSPGSVSSQSSNRSSSGNPNSNHANNPPMMNPNGAPGGGSNGAGGGGRVKGVPQSFGYVKRQGGQAQQAVPNGGQVQGGGRTAQVSAVPRTKVKVSGGTQTCTQDLQIHKGGGGVKSFSLSGSAASQLSQSVRERLMMGSQSLPKPGSHDFAVLFQHHRVPPRGGMKISDGSLSDTQTYSDVKSDYGSPYTSWLRHSNTYSATGRLSECDSMESLQSLQPGGSTRAPPRLLHQPAPNRLNRSNSIRSTKSEKLYPSMLQRSSEGEYEPYYCLPVHYGDGQGIPYGASEPPSPSPRSALSPPHGPPQGHMMSGTMPQHQLVLPSQHHSARHSHYKKNDDAHGSTASLVSTASSLHSSAEERQAHEARKLRRELTDAKEKVHTLTTQLTTNVS